MLSHATDGFQFIKKQREPKEHPKSVILSVVEVLVRERIEPIQNQEP